jgi:hypothetical protein
VANQAALWPIKLHCGQSSCTVANQAALWPIKLHCGQSSCTVANHKRIAGDSQQKNFESLMDQVDAELKAANDIAQVRARENVWMASCFSLKIDATLRCLFAEDRRDATVLVR